MTHYRGMTSHHMDWATRNLLRGMTSHHMDWATRNLLRGMTSHHMDWATRNLLRGMTSHHMDWATRNLLRGMTSHHMDLANRNLLLLQSHGMTRQWMNLLLHDYQSEEWQAIARILVVGWRIARYFPVKLAVPFLEEALYATSTSSLKDTFLQYVSEQEREVLVKALEDFNSVDTDALFDALEAHECQQVPTKDNLIPLLSQMGHKALIQAPMYVIKCWRPIVVHLASVLPQDALNDVIQQKTPTGKAVKELLQFPDEMTPPQTAVARYLKRYVVAY
ncbi:hypothetical protein NQZ68_040459 [Dissostichus eleginoides]|nr:hypothetical protein NQZ68_040459 [Dissostichus eleginoides]